MRRALGWLSNFWWHNNEGEQDGNVPDTSEIITDEEIIEADIINPIERPVDLPRDFDPTTHEGWNFMIITLTTIGRLSYH